MTSSNATPSAFGWDFQANLGLYLIMDEDLKQIKKFKIEGETEDIEIYYRDTTERKPKFIQAKSQENPISDGTTSKHLSNALSSLLQVVTKVSGEYSELIYGTNIEIPIRARVKQKLFEGNRIKLYYKELPEQFQTKIDGIVDVSEITSEELMSFKERFSILKISFYGQDNETRYKVVQEKVTSKLRSLGIEQYKCNRIFYYFQKEFIQNASKRVEYSIEDLGLTIILFSFEDEENWSFNMNLRVIRVDKNGLPKEDSPFKTYQFEELANNDVWEESHPYLEICNKRFLFVIFREISDKLFVLDGIKFWGFPDRLIPEIQRVWNETRNIIRDGVELKLNGNKVSTNFPQSKLNTILFTKIHAQNTYYEIRPNEFVGKGKLSDTDKLPDGRRITKHSFWIPKKFLKEVLLGEWD